MECLHNFYISDGGTSFLSKLMNEMHKLLGLKEVNFTVYHPQTDKLMEQFNCALTDILSKKIKQNRKDWDQQLLYLMFRLYIHTGTTYYVKQQMLLHKTADCTTKTADCGTQNYTKL